MCLQMRICVRVLVRACTWVWVWYSVHGALKLACDGCRRRNQQTCKYRRHHPSSCCCRCQRCYGIISAQRQRLLCDFLLVNNACSCCNLQSLCLTHKHTHARIHPPTLIYKHAHSLTTCKYLCNRCLCWEMICRHPRSGVTETTSTWGAGRWNC